MWGKRKLRILTAVFLTVVGCMSPVHAKDAETDTSVSYLPQDIFKRMHVIVAGHGTVCDGTHQIRNGINIYQLKPGDIKQFAVIADTGYILKNIIFDGEDIQGELTAGSRIEVAAPNYDSVLTIIFEQNSVEENTPEHAGSTGEEQMGKDVSDIVIPMNPSKPLKENKEVEKKIAAIVVKTIPLKNLKNKITNEMLRTVIQTDLEYTILSHNIQKKAGLYEAVIQLEDGSIQILTIEVEDSKDIKAGGVADGTVCGAHWYILVLMILFISYTTYEICKNAYEIQKWKDKLQHLKNREEHNEA